MSTTTTNLELIKPEATDNVSLSDYNFNLDTIDTAMVDYVIESGTSGIWKYKKMASGEFELFGQQVLPSVTPAAYANQFLAFLTTYIDFPFTAVTAMAWGTLGNATDWHIGRVVCSTSQITSLTFFAPGEYTASLTVNLLVKGTWK